MKEEVSGKIPPHSLEAEMAVLGSMLIDRETIDKVLSIVNEEHFYKPEHKKIFKVICKLYEKNKPVDITTVASELKKEKIFEEVGGGEYLVSLTEAVGSTQHVEEYANIVLEKAISRELISISYNIIDRCFQDKEDPKTLLDMAEQWVLNIRKEGIRSHFVHIKERIHDIVDEVAMYCKKGEFPDAIKTGYTDLDVLTGGFHKGNLIIIAARPSLGKTALCLNIAEYIGLKLKKPVGIFSLEMTEEEIIKRMICSRARLDWKKIRSGKISHSEWRKYTDAAAELGEASIYINELPSSSILDLRAEARRAKRELGIEIIFIDYIQLLSGVGRYESRQQEMAEISRSLKSLARDLNIPVVAVSQLSRKPEEREHSEPRLSDLRESGALEQDADVVIFIYRDVQEKKPNMHGLAKIIVAKQRNGPQGHIYLTFLQDCTRFENRAPESEEL
jgi:replicative DNA helicase